MKKLLIAIYSAILLFACTSEKEYPEPSGMLQISENGHYFMDGKGNPFFWLGDTGWILFNKLTREEACHYLDVRTEQGFNIVQVMVIPTVTTSNIYGDSALVNGNVSRPVVTEGNSFENPEEYDYWDHIDYVIEEAAKRRIYVALVPVWGINMRAGLVNVEQGRSIGQFVAKRYRDVTNIIWINGGDDYGSDSTSVWNAIGESLREYDPNHLITFHPYGRTQSSWWFHDTGWLDFNMFQSGHRRYDQDDTPHNYGEDNWRYVQTDFNLLPTRPTLDGEPSYENIPQGIHDLTQPRWKDDAVRRYAYWSVFAGSAGHTYGHNSVFPFISPNDRFPGIDPQDYWTEGIKAPGAQQLIHLKNLMLSHPYFERIPDQSLVNDGCQGERYDYIIATRGNTYAFLYTYNGKKIAVNMGKIEGKKVNASWYNPRNGETIKIGKFANTGVQEFDPPGKVENGNDWVLILEKSQSFFKV